MTTTEDRFHGDYVRVPSKYPLLDELSPRLIKCKAGDLIVWDSRSIHCNSPAFVDKEKENPLDLLRVVTYICMSPASMFVPNMSEYKTLEEFRELREEYVRDGITCTHWPLELIDSSTFYQENLFRNKINFYTFRSRISWRSAAGTQCFSTFPCYWYKCRT